MKKTYSILVTFLLLAGVSCQQELGLPCEQADESRVMAFSFSVPEYRTRAIDENDVRQISLLVFDEKGLFVKRMTATDVNASQQTFKAEVPLSGRIVHAIANYSGWAEFDSWAAPEKDEGEVVTKLSSADFVFWSRIEIAPTSVNTPISETFAFIRNQAKVTVESNAANFTVLGYALCNYLPAGTAAPFHPGESQPFSWLDKPTLPAGVTTRVSQTESECTNEPKYLFENENHYNDQTYVVIKAELSGGAVRYFKVQLLDADKNPYQVVRNYRYRIVINTFADGVQGALTFDEAKAAEPSNNIYAEILKESLSVSDNDGNTLAVDQLNFLFTSAGALEVQATYVKNGIPANGEITVQLDQSAEGAEIISALTVDQGTIRAHVSAVASGIKEARIIVRAGVLSRTITVVSSPVYHFTPVSISSYMFKDEEVTLTFSVPSDLPEFLFPLKCMIKAENLYPVAPNVNMLIAFEGGTFKYTYLAEAPGLQTVKFKTSLADSDETVTVENPYFVTGTADLKGIRFGDVKINTANEVLYGAGSNAVLSFTAPEIATYPMTVFIATTNLKSDQSGLTAVSGGYNYQITSAGTYTIGFTTKANNVSETLRLSAEGLVQTACTYSVSDELGADIVIPSQSGRLRYGNNNDIPESAVITSSDTSVVPNFTVVTAGRYNGLTVKSGSRLSDTVTLSYTRSSNTYTVQVSVTAILNNNNITLTR